MFRLRLNSIPDMIRFRWIRRMGIHLIIRTQFGKRKVPVTFASKVTGTQEPKVTGTFILSANIEKYEKEVRNASGDYEEMEDEMHIFLVFHFVKNDTESI